MTAARQVGNSRAGAMDNYAFESHLFHCRRVLGEQFTDLSGS